MLYAKAVCPHCGNEITVNNARETQKCCYCRRLLSVSICRGKGRKVKCEVEPKDFSDDQKFNCNENGHHEWKDVEND